MFVDISFLANLFKRRWVWIASIGTKTNIEGGPYEIEIEILLFIEWKVIQKFNRDEEVQRRTYVHPGILHIY